MDMTLQPKKCELKIWLGVNPGVKEEAAGGLRELGLVMVERLEEIWSLWQHFSKVGITKNKKKQQSPAYTSSLDWQTLFRKKPLMN